MSLKLGSTELSKLYLGGLGINKAYLGALEVFGSISAFTSTWTTTGASETIQLPIANLYTIDWGDGATTTTDTNHEYLTAGQYTIKSPDTITDFTFIGAGDVSKMINISNLGNILINGGTFQGCLNLDITATDSVTTAISLASSFSGCTSLVYNPSINELDVSLCENMLETFRGCSLFNQPLGNWDMSSCLTTNGMFRVASNFNQNIDTWSVHNITNTSLMFQSASNFNSPLNSWVTTSLTLCNAMFRAATSFNQPIGNWDMSNVTNMSLMFDQAYAFNQDISSWDFSSVTNISNFMKSKSAANYLANYYDNLLIKWDNAVGGLVFSGMGSIKRTAAGSAAHASLSAKGFVITDGGI